MERLYGLSTVTAEIPERQLEGKYDPKHRHWQSQSYILFLFGFAS